MNTSLIKNPIVLFLLKALALYLLWYVLYVLWLHPYEKCDLFVIDKTLAMSKKTLELMQFKLFTGTDRLIGIEGTNGLWMGDNCNGIELFALFSGFIIAYPGPWLKKIIFIPLGILSIQILNSLRVVALAIIEIRSIKLTEFNHSYTFTILMYGYIFFLWMLWVNKFSVKKIHE
ncbi:MAG TPA: hypothetical protein VNG53_03995 [Bacteroidia bacterium]|nr:hypothetical protein [Bacteroidia bacterium]